MIAFVALQLNSATPLVKVIAMPLLNRVVHHPAHLPVQEQSDTSSRGRLRDPVMLGMPNSLMPARSHISTLHLR